MHHIETRLYNVLVPSFLTLKEQCIRIETTLPYQIYTLNIQGAAYYISKTVLNGHQSQANQPTCEPGLNTASETRPDGEYRTDGVTTAPTRALTKAWRVQVGTGGIKR